MFKFLKFTFKNFHFKNVVFSNKILDDDIKYFVKNCKRSSENVIETNIESNTKESVSSSDEDETDIEIDDGFKETELKEENSKMVDDSILIPFGRPSEVGSSLVDVIACQIEKRGLVSKKRLKSKTLKARKRYMKKYKIAPAEGNTPQNWLSDEFLEEKAFPHLFPSGRRIMYLIVLRGYPLLLSRGGVNEMLSQSQPPPPPVTFVSSDIPILLFTN